MAQVINFGDLERFAQSHMDKIVLVDFFAPWCGPCKWQADILESIVKMKEWKNAILIVKIDIDTDEKRSNELKIKSIPTLMFYKRGERQKIKDGKKKTDRLIGLRQPEELLRVLGELCN